MIIFYFFPDIRRDIPVSVTTAVLRLLTSWRTSAEKELWRPTTSTPMSGGLMYELYYNHLLRMDFCNCRLPVCYMNM